MRTTLNTIYSQINTSLNKITDNMATLTNQISSGSQMSKISDDPVNLVSALRFRSSIVELDQYTENINLGITTISGSENALSQMKELTIRAKELTIQAINPVLSASEHTAIAVEIQNLNEQAVMLANSQVNGKYIFAGQRTTNYTDAEPAPFVMDQGNGHWLNGKAPTGPTTIPANTLKINGITIEASLDTATSKAEKINDVTLGASGAPGTGVIAEIIPATVQGGDEVVGSSVGAGPGSFAINSIDIGPLGPLSGDATDNVVVDAINLKSGQTGVEATLNDVGKIMLTAVDGRNISITGTDTANTGLINGTSYGSIKLSSDREFTLEDLSADPTATPPPTEDAFAALGITGGSTETGESTDVVADGKIDVVSIHKQSGSVRYNGDLQNDLKIKIGKSESMVIGFNGKKAVADTSIFTTLQQLEDALRNTNFTSVSGIKAANYPLPSDLIDAGTTGLDSENYPFAPGRFSITITDHDYEPPVSKTMTINVDPSADTLTDIASRIDGVPNISATWDNDSKLQVNSDNPGRYTFSMDNDTSNFLINAGVDSSAMQYTALNNSLDNLDFAMDSITEQVSNFGAKANRVDVQLQIYSGLQLAAQENLSSVQDTDLIKATIDLKSAETAYQAALAAAAKTMQLSLVDFL